MNAPSTPLESRTHLASLALVALVALAIARLPAPPAPDGTRWLTVWLAADYAQAPLFDAVDAEFEAAHPGVKVKRLGVPWEDMPTKVKTAVIGGRPPDVAHQHPFALGAQGFAEPLDDLWARWGARDQFLPGALEDARWRGRMYGVPLDINCTVLVYDRAALARRGVAEPDGAYSFDRWRSDLLALTDPGAKRYGVGLTTGAWHTYAFVRANGGELLEERDGRMRATFTDPRTVAAVDFVAGLGHRDRAGPTPTTRARDYDDATALFTGGRAAMIYTGPWDFRTIAERAPGLDFGVSPFPAGLDGVRRGSVQGGGGLFVPKGARERELAFAWMRIATGDRHALALAKMGRYPARSAPLAQVRATADPRLRAFLDALPHARPYKLDAYPQANHAFADAVKAAFYGHDAREELARAQGVAQASIDALEAQ
jgi:ABC-type glycerol-3-phosphate transport system substrate-binding protein